MTEFPQFKTGDNYIDPDREYFGVMKYTGTMDDNRFVFLLPKSYKPKSEEIELGYKQQSDRLSGKLDDEVLYLVTSKHKGVLGTMIVEYHACYPLKAVQRLERGKSV